MGDVSVELAILAALSLITCMHQGLPEVPVVAREEAKS